MSQGFSSAGSSPRMRGARYGVVPQHVSAGIIPADAGSTGDSNLMGLTLRWGDHPRGCGEHYGLDLDDLGHSGSSPRMRGALVIRGGDVAGVGIIPADAGSTGRHAPGLASNEDHPRGCGEHCRTRPDTRCRGGSSPRMRGAQAVDHQRGAVAGIIPADAGSTRREVGSGQIPQDHPRGCGEHSFPLRLQLHLKGSSPRMRGAQLRGQMLLRVHRIIPADAGSTCTGL